MQAPLQHWALSEHAAPIAKHATQFFVESQYVPRQQSFWPVQDPVVLQDAAHWLAAVHMSPEQQAISSAQGPPARKQHPLFAALHCSSGPQHVAVPQVHPASAPVQAPSSIASGAPESPEPASPPSTAMKPPLVPEASPTDTSLVDCPSTLPTAAESVSSDESRFPGAAESA